MKRDRIRELIAAYGADPARWPEAESVAAGALAPNDPELIAARQLDSLLARFEAPPVDPALVERIVARAADLPQERRRTFERRRLLPRLGGRTRILPGLPWTELVAMTAALVLGFYIGMSGVGYTNQLAYTNQVAASTFGDASLTLATVSTTTGLFHSDLFR